MTFSVISCSSVNSSSSLSGDKGLLSSTKVVSSNLVLVEEGEILDDGTGDFSVMDFSGASLDKDESLVVLVAESLDRVLLPGEG